MLWYLIPISVWPISEDSLCEFQYRYLLVKGVLRIIYFVRTSIFFIFSDADNSYNVEVRAEECARKGVVDNPVDVDNREQRAEECARKGVVDNPVGVDNGDVG